MQHERSIVEGVGGVRLAAQRWSPDSTPRAHVVIHHGLWDYADYYAPFAEALTVAGYAVYAYDMRGHGTSDGERYMVGAFDEYTGDLDRFLQSVFATAKDRPVFLFGHSLGGLIATLYALNAPQNRLRGFVLSGAGLKAGAEVTALLKALAPLLGALLPRQPSFKPDFKFASRDQQVGLRKSADDKIDQKGLPARSGAAGLKAIAAVQSRMESFDKPVLIMHGSEDRWTDPDGSRQLMSRARSSDKSLKLYDGLYHELVSDTERERVWGDIVAWLDARS